MTDDDLLAAYADYQRAGNRAARTIKSRASILRGFARRQDTTLLDATVFHMRREVGRAGIAPASRASTRSAFLAFYGFLHEEGLRDDNPALRLPVVKVPPHRPRPYTQEQIDLMLSSGAYRRTRVMILLAAYEGLRALEIAAVHADDIDLKAGTLKVAGKGGRVDYLRCTTASARSRRRWATDGGSLRAAAAPGTSRDSRSATCCTTHASAPASSTRH